MRVLVCGSRTFKDKEYLYKELDKIHHEHRITCIIEGEAKGADTLAKMWALWYDIPFDPYPANWYPDGPNGQRHRAAGPIRNRKMLVEGKPEMVIAFCDKPLESSRGTKNMVTIASRAGVPVLVFVIKPQPEVIRALPKGL